MRYMPNLLVSSLMSLVCTVFVVFTGFLGFCFVPCVLILFLVSSGQVIVVVIFRFFLAAMLTFFFFFLKEREERTRSWERKRSNCIFVMEVGCYEASNVAPSDGVVLLTHARCLGFSHVLRYNSGPRLKRNKKERRRRKFGVVSLSIIVIYF